MRDNELFKILENLKEAGIPAYQNVEEGDVPIHTPMTRDEAMARDSGYDFDEEMDVDITGDDGEQTAGTVRFKGNFINGKPKIDISTVRASAHQMDGNSKLGFDDDFDTEMFLGDEQAIEELEWHVADKQNSEGIGEDMDDQELETNGNELSITDGTGATKSMKFKNPADADAAMQTMAMGDTDLEGTDSPFESVEVNEGASREELESTLKDLEAKQDSNVTDDRDTQKIKNIKQMIANLDSGNEQFNEAEQLDEFLPALAAVGGMAARGVASAVGGIAKAGAQAAGASLGASAADKIFGEDDEGAEYSSFDSENPSHRKRLQRGTPVVLTPSICPDPNGDRTGIFVNLSSNGFHGKVLRNCDGKHINVNLDDIVSADITNNSVYENFEAQFENVMEDITITKTQNLESPENDTTTVTAIGDDAAAELEAMMNNAGLNQTQASMTAYDPAADTDVDTIDNGAPQVMPMQQALDVMDAPPEEAGPVDEPEVEAAMEPELDAGDEILTEPEADDAYDFAKTGYPKHDLSGVEDDMEESLEDEHLSDDSKLLNLIRGIQAIPERGEEEIEIGMEEDAIDAEPLSKLEQLIKGIQAIPKRGEHAVEEAGYNDDGFASTEADGSPLDRTSDEDEWSSAMGHDGDDPEEMIGQPDDEVEEASDRIHARVRDRDESGDRIHARVQERGTKDLDAGEEVVSEEGDDECPKCDGVKMVHSDEYDMPECPHCGHKEDGHDDESFDYNHNPSGDDEIEEERDIQHANTPDEQIAQLSAIIQGMAGGLNGPKGTYGKVAGGDNPMQPTMEGVDSLTKSMDLFKAVVLEAEEEDKDDKKKEWKKPWEDDKEDEKEDLDKDIDDDKEEVTEDEDSKTCGNCEGSGYSSDGKTCNDCEGSGELEESKEEVTESETDKEACKTCGELFTPDAIADHEDNCKEDLDESEQQSFLDLYRSFQMRGEKRT